MRKSIIKNTIKLKECPWCKKIPSLFKEELWNGSHGYIGCYSYFVECDNPECKINPCTKKYNDIYKDDELMCVLNACNDWNDRG